MRSVPFSFFLLLLTACTSGGTPDAGLDGGAVDMGTPDTGTAVDGGTDAGPISLPGLHMPVNVIRDTRGMIHIYAADLHDATFAQGYLQAQDRFPEMELTRRSVTGRLAEVVGAVQPSTIDQDLNARWAGYARDAVAIYATLADGSDTKIAVDAFSEGVSLYIHKLRAGTARLPVGSGLELLNFVIFDPSFDDWHPTDTIAIGRYLSHALSYNAGTDIENTQARLDIAAAFPSTSTDPRLAARANAFHDFFGFEPAEHVYTRMGIPNVPTDTGSRAYRASSPRLSSLFRDFLPSDPTALAQAGAALHAVGAIDRVIAPRDRGSNDWVVSGTHTASGGSLLANDPHLSLQSPALFWYVHLSTKHNGGTTDVEGLSLVGTPGVILGFNSDIAWGVTTADHDVTDVYEEHFTAGTGGAPDTVAYMGGQVPVEDVTEVVHVSGGMPDVVAHFERVPHHGLVIANISGGAVMPRTAATAYSVRWTGDEPSSELTAFVGIDLATSIDTARDNGIHNFEVGAQNFVVIERASPRIYWSTHARIPVRPATCLMYDPVTGAGTAPMFVLPGDGSCEWGPTQLDNAFIPHEDNPARGYIATANNDQCGEEDDGNPANDAKYLGFDHDRGWRIARIDEELRRLTTAGGVTVADMQALQGDEQSALGRRLTPALLTSIAHVLTEHTTPGTYPSLTSYASALSAANVTTLMGVQTRLTAWTSFDAPSGVADGSATPPTTQQITDSIATTIFNATIVRLNRLAFKDETDAMHHAPWGEPMSRLLQWSLTDPMNLQTYDATISDTVLWDDITTAGVETRDEMVARAVLDAHANLAAPTLLGPDESQWQWGHLHTLTLSALIPAVSGSSPLQLPREGDALYPHGYPRHGDLWGIDAPNYDLWTTSADYTYNAGPQQRLVVEMLPDGPHAYNALPGGEILDVRSPHFHDELELWRHNEAPPLYYTDADVSSHTESSWTLTP